MLGLGKTRTAGAPAADSRVCGELIYQRHAAALYQQALLMLDDPALAEDVVCDAIVDECALVPTQERGEDETRYRLAQSVFWRCQQLAAGATRRRRLRRQPSPGIVGYIDPDGILSVKERGALGLVLCGGLGYVQASAVLRMGPHEMADLLRTVMRRLAISPPAMAGDGDQVCGALGQSLIRTARNDNTQAQKCKRYFGHVIDQAADERHGEDARLCLAFGPTGRPAIGHEAAV